MVKCGDAAMRVCLQSKIWDTKMGLEMQ